MTAFSLGARLHLGASSSLALSLPQSSPLNPVRLDSFAPSPFSARASAIRSRTCGRQRLAFLAASATGGARKPNPSEGAEAATAASHRIAKVQTQAFSLPQSASLTALPPQREARALPRRAPNQFNCQTLLLLPCRCDNRREVRRFQRSAADKTAVDILL